MAQVIKVVRIMEMQVKTVDGKQTLVPRLKIERERDLSIYDINTDAYGQRYMAVREY